MEVKIGDIVIPGPNNGLGWEKFKVIYIATEACVFPICVEGSNGQQWWIRREGIKVLQEETAVLETEDRKYKPRWRHIEGLAAFHRSGIGEREAW